MCKSPVVPLEGGLCILPDDVPIRVHQIYPSLYLMTFSVQGLRDIGICVWGPSFSSSSSAYVQLHTGETTCDIRFFVFCACCPNEHYLFDISSPSFDIPITHNDYSLIANVARDIGASCIKKRIKKLYVAKAGAWKGRYGSPLSNQFVVCDLETFKTDVNSIVGADVLWKYIELRSLK